MFYELKISKNGLRDFIICKQPLKFKGNKKLDKLIVNEKKLDCNVSRARSKLFEYASNNDFEYFVTLTINSNHDRFNLNNFRKQVSQIIRDMRRRGYRDLNYILIPEYHKDGAIHFHGLFSAGFGQDFYINDNGFLSWSSFDYIGYSSFSKIKSIKACCKYITKYITKDLVKIHKGNYIYFHSQGLKTNEFVSRFVTSGLIPLNFEFVNKYISKSTIDYYDYVTFIDFMISNGKIYLCDKNIY